MSDSLGVSVNVHESLSKGTQQLFSMTDQLSSYSHELSAFGGYNSARIDFTARRDDIDEWIEYGLGRRIVTYDEAGDVIFEGFVNQLSARMGGLEFSVGPVLDISNYVRLIYSMNLFGQAFRLTTAWAPDTDSISKYGRVERVLSGGNVSDSEADQIRDTYLAEHANPVTSREQSFSNDSGGLSVSLNVLGYFHWLDVYTYVSTTTGTVARSTLLQQVLAADPNEFLSSLTDNIDTNSTLVAATWDDNDKALAVVKHIVSGGDANDQRWLFGIYQDRKAHYNVIPSEVEYLQALGSPTIEVMTTDEQPIYPWQVRPGKWLFFPDFLVGRVRSDEALQNDPRALFVETVSFTAPWGLSINGSNVSTLAQKLARLGISGIGG